MSRPPGPDPAADPYAVLGLASSASAPEIAAAYRRLAKRWHPDRAGSDVQAARRMAEINAAYDLVRDGGWRRATAAAAHASATGSPRGEPVSRRRRAGGWLRPDVRRALGPELVAALQTGEDVALVVATTTWASPRTLLAVTDRRLLWLLDDAVVQRVQTLRFGLVAEVQVRLRRPRRRVALLRVRSLHGRPVTFSELEPATASAIERRVLAGARASAPVEPSRAAQR